MSKSKKFLSVLLACCVAFSAISISLVAFADNEAPTAEAVVTEESTSPELQPGDQEILDQIIDKYFGGDNQAFADAIKALVGSISGDNALEVPEWLQNIIEGAVGSGIFEGAIDQIMKWVAMIVTNDPNPENFMEVWEQLKEQGIVIGDIAQMTDEEVKAMLDQIYWVYADNPGPITQTVDCIKMFVNLVDAYIHATAQDVGPLNPMMEKLVTYYYNWLKEHCGLGWIPDLPDMTEPDTDPPTEPDTDPPTEPDTDPPTEPDTDPPTEPDTDPPTEDDTTTTTTEPPVTTPDEPSTEAPSTEAPSVSNVDNSTKSPDTGSASDAAIMVSAMIAFICASGAAVVFVKGKKQKDF